MYHGLLIHIVNLSHFTHVLKENTETYWSPLHWYTGQAENVKYDGSITKQIIQGRKNIKHSRLIVMTFYQSLHDRKKKI